MCKCGLRADDQKMIIDRQGSHAWSEAATVSAESNYAAAFRLNVTSYCMAVDIGNTAVAKKLKDRHDNL